MEPPPTDHDCPLVPVVADLSAKLAAALARIEKLERRQRGAKSEKMPPPPAELRKTETPDEAEARRLAALHKRQERAALKKQVEAEVVRHAVPDEAKGCPKCGGTADRPIGDGKTTTEYEYVPGRFKRIEHTQQKLACRCGRYIATAPPPPRALEKGLYGPGFVAHLVTMSLESAKKARTAWKLLSRSEYRK